jgi:hypothetical protein
MNRFHRAKWGWAGLGALAALGCASPALADYRGQQLDASSCDALGCTRSVRPQDEIGGFVSASGAQASASGWQGGLVTASASFIDSVENTQGNFSELSEAAISYTFQIAGTPSTLVPLRVYGLASISPILASTEQGGLLGFDSNGVPNGNAFFTIGSAATISVSGTGLQPDSGLVGRIDAAESLGNMISHGQEGSNINGAEAVLDQTMWFMSDTDITVSLAALANLSYSGYQTNNAIYGSVHASVDPTFTIEDPAYSAFSVVGVLSGPSPASPVPEPVSWELMILGIGMLGGALRLQRSRGGMARRPAPAAPMVPTRVPCRFPASG